MDIYKRLRRVIDPLKASEANTKPLKAGKYDEPLNLNYFYRLQLTKQSQSNQFP